VRSIGKSRTHDYHLMIISSRLQWNACMGLSKTCQDKRRDILLAVEAVLASV